MTVYEQYLKDLGERLQSRGIRLPMNCDEGFDSLEVCGDVFDEFLSFNKLLLVSDSSDGISLYETSKGVDINKHITDTFLAGLSATGGNSVNTHEVNTEDINNSNAEGGESSMTGNVTEFDDYDDAIGYEVVTESMGDDGYDEDDEENYEAADGSDIESESEDDG